MERSRGTHEQKSTTKKSINLKHIETEEDLHTNGFINGVATGWPNL